MQLVRKRQILCWVQVAYLSLTQRHNVRPNHQGPDATGTNGRTKSRKGNPFNGHNDELCTIYFVWRGAIFKVGAITVRHTVITVRMFRLTGKSLFATNGSLARRGPSSCPNVWPEKTRKRTNTDESSSSRTAAHHHRMLDLAQQ